LKFSQYLPANGWLPLVLTVENGTYPERDPALLHDVPDEVKVYRASAWDPYGVFNLLRGRPAKAEIPAGVLTGEPTRFADRAGRWVRANFFIPDARITWRGPARRLARDILRKERPDAILTSGPPHTVHLIGLDIHRHSGIPWIADFRDAWVDPTFFDRLPLTSWARKRHERLERQVYETASCITAVSPGIVQRIREVLGTTDKVTTIYNGFDPADYAQLKPSRPEQFVITHAGTFSARRDCPGFFTSLKALADSHPDVDIRLQLIGHVSDDVVRSIRESGVSHLCVMKGFVPHSEALSLMGGSALLLLALSDAASHGIVTGKVFEYMAVQKRVIGVGPRGSIADEILSKSGAGEMFAHEDVAGMLDYLTEALRVWKSGSVVPGASRDAIALYDRRAQTARLASILDTITEPHGDADE
jgi:glycosyltransferase involved in cell wall biosynthesis